MLAMTCRVLSLLGTLSCLALPAYAKNDFTLGVDGFIDHYSEPDASVDTHADFGSIDARYTHTSDQLYISRLEWRGSYGKDNYKSFDGVSKNTPQYETELRLLTGVTIPLDDDDTLIPFLGLGSRFFYDNGKGSVTNLGFFGYDRRILQFYVPIGAEANIVSGSWKFSPSAEVDPLALGKVNSRLQNGGFGDPNITNTQHGGYGLRAKFMVGQQYKDFGWQLGPFIRYWHIPDSKLSYNQAQGKAYLEPDNTRLQTGLELDVNF